MPTPRFLLLAGFVVALAPASARAHSVSDEVSLGSTQPSPTNPTSSFVTDTLRGGVDLSDTLMLRVNLGLTHDKAPEKRPGATFHDSGGNVFTSALGLDWEATEHFSFGFELDYSPDSTQTYDSSIQVPDPKTDKTVDTDALLRASNGSKGVLLSAGFTTLGDADSDLETSLDISASYTDLDTLQTLARVEEAGRPVGPEQLRTECARLATIPVTAANKKLINTAKATCRALRQALRGEGASLRELQLRAILTETLFGDTDLMLSGAYSHYNQDPTQVGYFSKLVLGHTRPSFGNGIPIAPVLWSVRPEVSHRFGGFLADLWYNYNRYYGTEGYGHSLGLKLQYKFTQALRAWASGTVQGDTQPEQVNTSSDTGSLTTVSTTLALGLKYSW